jgi:hypothetical protein
VDAQLLSRALERVVRRWVDAIWRRPTEYIAVERGVGEDREVVMVPRWAVEQILRYALLQRDRPDA